MFDPSFRVEREISSSLLSRNFCPVGWEGFLTSSRYGRNDSVCSDLAILMTVLLSAVWLSGCGQRLPGRPSGLPVTTPCTLTVTFGGVAVENVAVLFTPNDKSRHWYAGGKTDQKGTVLMKTGGHYDGVIPGEYTVSFQKTGRVELDEHDMPVRSHSLIPIKYAVGQSKEIIIVTKEQSVYVFELDGDSDSQ